MPAPDSLFNENQARLAAHARDSAYLDSRIERWSFHSGQDAGLSRAALAAGFTVRFYDKRRGHVILLHVVRPDEVR